MMTNEVKRHLAVLFKHPTSAVYDKVCVKCSLPKLHATKNCPGLALAKNSTSTKRTSIATVNKSLPPLPTANPPAAAPEFAAEAQPDSAPSSAPMPHESNQTGAVQWATGASEPHDLDTEFPPEQRAKADLLMEYIRVFAGTQQTPKVYAGKPTKEYAEFAVKNNIFTNRVPFPEQLMIPPGHSVLGRFRLSAAAGFLSTAVLERIDYEGIFPEMVPACGFKCHCGKRLHRQGYSRTAKILKEFGLMFCVYLFMLYKCEQCRKPKPGCASSSYSALSKHVVDQLDEELKVKIRFTTEGPFLSKAVVDFVDSMVTNPNRGFQGISTAIADSSTSELARRDMSRFLDAETRSSMFRTVKVSEDLLPFASLVVPRAEVLIEAFVAFVGGFMLLIQQSFLNTMIDADAFQLDHWHPNGYSGNPQGHIGTVTILHPTGEVMCLQGHESVSLSLSKPVLIKLRSLAGGKLCGAYVDSPLTQGVFCYSAGSNYIKFGRFVNSNESKVTKNISCSKLFHARLI
jgi:hypothetical protein